MTESLGKGGSNSLKKIAHSLDQLQVNIDKWKDLLIIEEHQTSESAIVNMLRQRMQQTNKSGQEATLQVLPLPNHESNLSAGDSDSVNDRKPSPSARTLSRNLTLALISLEKDDDVGTEQRADDNDDDDNDKKSNHGENDTKDDDESTKEKATSVCFWPFTLLEDRPLWRLFVVMGLNGLLSLACSAMIIKIEGSEQQNRLDNRYDLLSRIEQLKDNITGRFKNVHADAEVTLQLIDEFSNQVEHTRHFPQEIEWNMLSAQSFITSIQTTTGYGDIVPVTTGGRVFTVAYALIGIPVFMWYIVKLGGLFRLLVMNAFGACINCICPKSFSAEEDDTISQSTAVESGDGEPQYSRRRSTLETLLLQANSRIKEQFSDDKRFHPSVIGIILLVFLLSVSIFISHMEGISYFDSFYACFITYSTIGFGDIDIFKISYRSNWFNLLIYGNFVHILGYMILSAWIASILEKVGVRKF